MPRPRLLARLNAGRLRALTLVSAPAGWGNTTLLVEWLNRAAAPRDRAVSSPARTADDSAVDVAWLALEPRDNEPYHLLRLHRRRAPKRCAYRQRIAPRPAHAARWTRAGRRGLKA